MGLDATVRCRCWEEGRTTLCPFPELVYLDWEDHLDLTLPWDNNEESFRRFDEWRRVCCTHEDMIFAHERISNWSGYRFFQERLAQIGWQHFPVLQAELPNNNGGLTRASAAAAALEELAFVESIVHPGEDAVLVDLADGVILHHYIEAYQGVFILDGKSGVDLGVDANVFFVRLRAKGEKAGCVELFRTKEFEQEQIREDEIVLRDVDTQEVFRARCGVTRFVLRPDEEFENEEGRLNQIYPKHLKVEMRQRTPVELDYIIQPLKRIFRASVETGNPVRWC